ncbi:sporulation protein, yteA family [Desulfitobacterium dichloroeliminans LMG P-21439]|uniref:Sporulation protein, yteA family n=1 Tax=Desulfitobacterium dichloroeliminans (strain LMG P-21439 / DCA1) TaxID=871963 RepID=L0FC10_DESDL|nr:TraR/DksA C4-type zinc finger protein [Desulfitobacterium dichloroeliminans]AGA70186.1 sporulation protein, yteA family [Desulfitobacterium dichloroeliminans LMG P-21439]
MSESKYAGLIEQLKKDKEEAMEMAAELITGDMRESLGELSVIDNHPADIATEVYERSRDVASHDRLKHRINAINSALQRYEEGEYGVCEHCQKDIPLERLEALPYTTVCTACSRLEEKEEQHSLHRDPVEDELINSPFSRTFNDGTDRVGFDGEDSWQAVASFGTSDSPQDLGTNRDLSDPNTFYEDGDEVIGAVQAVETLEVEVEPGLDNTVYYGRKHGRT